MFSAVGYLLAEQSSVFCSGIPIGRVRQCWMQWDNYWQSKAVFSAVGYLLAE